MKASRIPSTIALLAVLLNSFAAAQPTFAKSAQVLFKFRLRDGANPMGNLIADPSGSLYGTTSAGGPANAGTVYRLTRTPSGYHYDVLHTFGPGQGSSPEGGLAIDVNGTLYGTTELGGTVPYGSYGTVFKMTPTGSGYAFSTLYTFRGNENGDGESPMAAVTIGPGGVVYGTTSEGGTSNWCGLTFSAPGCGIVFKLTPTGSSYQETVLHNFAGARDGALPSGGLVLDRRGALYGTTYAGGSGCNKTGCGIVFRINVGKKQRKQTVYQFGGIAKRDGAEPYGPLSLGSHGELFGTAALGGVRGAGCPNGCGMVFQLSQSGAGYAEDTLYAFDGTSQGAGPESGVMADARGDLFGTTSFGGNSGCAVGCGTVFELVRRGSAYREKTLHAFRGGRGGWFSNSDPLYLNASGDLFGVTYYGGFSGKKCTGVGCGTIFELSGAASR